MIVKIADKKRVLAYISGKQQSCHFGSHLATNKTSTIREKQRLRRQKKLADIGLPITSKSVYSFLVVCPIGTSF